MNEERSGKCLATSRTYPWSFVTMRKDLKEIREEFMELRQDLTECKTDIADHRQEIHNINTRHIPPNICSKLCLMVLNVTFNTISVLSRRSVLLVEETG
jgi:hypothetical protein